LTPAVSVVITCHNLGEYVDDAVQSVLDQTFHDVEILLVDDGSDEPATRAVLDNYRRPRTRVIRTANQGLSLARNCGLQQARGAYVSFLDADDMLQPRFLERTVDLLDDRPDVSFASCWLTAFGAEEFEWTPERCDFPWLLAEDTVCTAALTRSDAARAVGGFDPDPQVAGYQDWAIAISLVAAGFAGEIIREPLFRYRIRPGSMTSWCTRPEHHNRVIEYLVDKHAELYRAHAAGVIDAIRRRTDDLEADLPRIAPTGPPVDLSGAGWRSSVLALERHRRDLEEVLRGATVPKTPADPPPVDWGSLRGLEPVSTEYGFDRGRPIDRYYTERFLAENAIHIQGHVLEVKDRWYTHSYHSGAMSSTVLDIDSSNPEATLIADLGAAGSLPESRFNCIILTQVLQYVFNLERMIENVYRALAPGGVVLATVPCVARIDDEVGVDADLWRFTTASMRRLCERRFPPGDVEVEGFGNVLACTAFLQGLATEDMEPEELERADPFFPLGVAVRAVKPGASTDLSESTAHGSVDEVSCSHVTGWAWDPTAPERRLLLDVLRDGERVSSVWADRYREDLAEAGIGDGRYSFAFIPEEPLHGEPEPSITVKPAGAEDPLGRGAQPATCRCTGGPVEQHPVLGFTIEAPATPDGLTFPEARVSGWALGRGAPLQAIEFAAGDQAFQRIPLDVDRPDLVPAFPDVPWAGAAGFSTQISLVAGGHAEIAVRGVLHDGEVVELAGLSGTGGRPATGQAVAVVDGSAFTLDSPPAVLRQDTAFARVFVHGAHRAPDQPGFEATPYWALPASASGSTLLWLSDGREMVDRSFLARAGAALAERPMSGFAVADVNRETTPNGMCEILSGLGLGAAVVFRCTAIGAVGGVDPSAPSATAAAWDVAIRLAEQGQEWERLVAAPIDAPALIDEGDDETVRWVYRKHGDLFARHLREVLVLHERRLEIALRANLLLENHLDGELLPRLQARRRERDRLGVKLRRPAEPRPTSPDNLTGIGDFLRLEPMDTVGPGDRAPTISRHYAERFLQTFAADIRGTVLSYADAASASRHGATAMERCDVFDSVATNHRATLIGELDDDAMFPSDRYDCVIAIDLLQRSVRPSAVIGQLSRVLKPGGVLLAAVPAVRPIDDHAPESDYWRFSRSGLRQIVEPYFEPSACQVRIYGNRGAAAAALSGLSASDVGDAILDEDDVAAPVVITLRAAKRVEAS
jgi:GT2 family glycosyltransferase/SAM-dependent methyltransferase